VNFTEVDGHLYNGILLANANSTAQRLATARASGSEDVRVEQDVPKNGIEGEMFAMPPFSLGGREVVADREAPRLDGSFTVKNGTVNRLRHGGDCALLEPEHMVGGRTHFEDMIGTMQLENHTLHFRQLRIMSGMLNASGSFDVSQGNQLSGNFNAEIQDALGQQPS